VHQSKDEYDKVIKKLVLQVVVVDNLVVDILVEVDSLIVVDNLIEVDNLMEDRLLLLEIDLVDTY